IVEAVAETFLIGEGKSLSKLLNFSAAPERFFLPGSGCVSTAAAGGTALIGAGRGLAHCGFGGDSGVIFILGGVADTGGGTSGDIADLRAIPKLFSDLTSQDSNITVSLWPLGVFGTLLFCGKDAPAACFGKLKLLGAPLGICDLAAKSFFIVLMSPGFIWIAVCEKLFCCFCSKSGMLHLILLDIAFGNKRGFPQTKNRATLWRGFLILFLWGIF
ncbi:MAG TPA: hypothetical protein PKM84_01520, partial [Candidatus Pacearchaeota archaeon]|nr:hypothetical protein [Candidatus Pacearchaeota archaeon]